MKSLLFLLLISFVAHADENCDLDLHPELNEITTLAKELESFAASEDQIASAPCTKKDPFTADEMSAWLRQETSKYKMSETINGISFEDESLENLKTFNYLTTAVDFIGTPLPAEQKIFTSNCKKVECAVKEIFGEEEGLQLLYMHRRFGMNGSHLVRTDSAPWPKKDLDTLLLSLSDFPDGLFPGQDNKMLKRGKPGMGFPGVYANATITVFDMWDTIKPNAQRSTITHELGHFLGGITHQADEDNWLKKSGWEKKTKVEGKKTIEFFESKKPETFVSKYATTNPGEDFAESVVAYRYNPQLLKEASPEKYETIKTTVFDGVEYTSELACANPSRESQKAKKIVDEKVNSWQPDEKDLIQMTKRCNKLAILDISRNGFVNNNEESFKLCYEKSIYKRANEMLKQQFKGHPLESYIGPILRNVKINISPNQVNSISLKVLDQHKKELKKYLTAALEDKFYCKANLQQYFYQKFEEMNQSSENYAIPDDYQKIAMQYCPKKGKKKSISEIVKAIVK